MTSQRSTYDVVVVGAGHNGLAAAGYLARAGLSVLVLERLAHVGGAAVSAVAFPGQPARLSRYADLVSLLPQQLVSDLELDLELASRATSSYTPTMRDGAPGGLIVERPEGPATAASFRALSGSDDDYAAWQAFRAGVTDLARVVAPTLLDPLPTERTIRDQVDAEHLARPRRRPDRRGPRARFADDTVRGVVASRRADRQLRPAARPVTGPEPLLPLPRRRRTGEWRCPWAAWARSPARWPGVPRRPVPSPSPRPGCRGSDAGDDGAEVTWHDGRSAHTVTACHVLANVAPWVLRILMGEGEEAETKPQGRS